MESKHVETVMAFWHCLTSLLCLTKIPNRLKKGKKTGTSSEFEKHCFSWYRCEWVYCSWLSFHVSFNVYCLPVSEKTVWGFFGTVLRSSTDYMVVRKIEIFVTYGIRR